MKKILLFLLFVSTNLLAQFSKDNSDLILSTANRTFDKSIITKYLSSKNENDVKAALIALYHSNDSTFVDDIQKIDFSKFGKEAAFALGGIANCRKSIDLLFRELQVEANEYALREIIESIGKTGNQSDFERLIIYAEKHKPFAMKSAMGILNFHLRNFSLEGREALILLRIINESQDDNDISEALFTLFRKTPTGITEKQFNYNHLLKSINDDIVINTIKLIPKIDIDGKENLLLPYLSNKDWRLRGEAAKGLCALPNLSLENFKPILRLLIDKNPNVSRLTAMSVRNIKTSSLGMSFLLNGINYYLKKDLTVNAKGELFISLCKLDSENAYNYINEYANAVSDIFIIRVLEEVKSSPNYNYIYLSKNISKENEKDIMNSAQAFLNLQKELIDSKEYTDKLIGLLENKYPSIISIIADGLDSTYIQTFDKEIKIIVLEQIKRNKNNSDYYESIASLSSLSSKLGKEFHNDILKELSQSDVTSIKNYADSQMGIKTEKKGNPLFNELLKDSFSVNQFLVKTNKGDIKIELMPEISPITVGSFTKLVKEKFFDNIIFHRVVPNFVIQTGDPSGTGWRGPGYDIISETSTLPYKEGMIGMASAGKDTEGSQWFIMHSYYPHLNGKYSLFGKVISGMETVNIIDQDDKIISILPVP
ncbi:MAG: peptidylprolyl isomerase [Melioribacteraceae bacterium]|nr:peptidylprolyl isomerase [Melioribacteraceae bacterium]